MSASSKRYPKAFPCMGGFCHSRDGCAHYHSTMDVKPADRLCGRVEEPVSIKPANEESLAHNARTVGPAVALSRQVPYE